MKIAFKYGLPAGLLIASWDALNYFFLYKTFVGRLSFLVDLAFLLCMLYFGIREFKRKKYNNEITFASASLAGIQICIVISLTLSLCTFACYSFDNSRYEEFYISETTQAMKVKNLPDIEKTITDLKVSFKPFNQARGAFLVTMLLGGVFSFLFGMILRNKIPDPTEGMLDKT